MAARLRRIVKSSPLLMRMAVPVFRMRSIVLAHVPIAGALPRFAGRAHLETATFESLDDFDAWRAANAEQINRWEDEDEAAVSPGRFAFDIPGYCAICEQSVAFLTTTEYGSVDANGVPKPNWREHLMCPHCHMRNRTRAALHIAIQDLDMTSDRGIYLTEQFGSPYRWMRGHFDHVVGSEYLSPRKESGSSTLGINHQDVQALSFASGSFDFVLTFDVLEHVPDSLAAFASFASVLKPGGRLVMTVPFTVDRYETTERAVMRPDGRIEHFLPIEVHGNPTDPVNGALCFRHFGWETLEQLTDVGFTEAKVHIYHSRELGYLGGAQWLITAIKS
jgi:hypothetical protein